MLFDERIAFHGTFEAYTASVAPVNSSRRFLFGSCAERKARSSLARARCVRYTRHRMSGSHGPFAALVAAASTHPSAGRGLACAYAVLPREGRERLIAAVVEDARSEGVSSAPALVSLLSVEEDPELARVLAHALLEQKCVELTPADGPRALLAGNESSGGLLLAYPLHSDFVELVGVAWTPSGVTHTVVEPVARREDLEAHSKLLPDGLDFDETPVSYAVDRFASVLWAHRRRHGALPEGLERFADLFSVRMTATP